MMMLLSGGLSTIVDELNGRLLPQMSLHGLKLSAYIIGNGIYNFMFPFLSGILLIILKYICFNNSAILGSIAYTSISYGIVFLLFLLWSYSQVLFFYLIDMSCFFHRCNNKK